MDSITKQELNEYLYALLGSDSLVEKWWNSRNPVFSAAPSSVWETEPEKVVEYVLGCIS